MCSINKLLRLMPAEFPFQRQKIARKFNANLINAPNADRQTREEQVEKEKKKKKQKRLPRNLCTDLEDKYR